MLVAPVASEESADLLAETHVVVDVVAVLDPRLIVGDLVEDDYRLSDLLSEKMAAQHTIEYMGVLSMARCLR